MICEEISLGEIFLGVVNKVGQYLLAILSIRDEAKFVLFIFVFGLEDVVKVRIWERFIYIELFQELKG